MYQPGKMDRNWLQAHVSHVGPPCIAMKYGLQFQLSKKKESKIKKFLPHVTYNLNSVYFNVSARENGWKLGSRQCFP